MTAGVRNTFIHLEESLENYGIDTVLTAVQELLMLYSANSIERAARSIPIYDAIQEFKKQQENQ